MCICTQCIRTQCTLHSVHIALNAFALSTHWTQCTLNSVHLYSVHIELSAFVLSAFALNAHCSCNAFALNECYTCNVHCACKVAQNNILHTALQMQCTAHPHQCKLHSLCGKCKLHSIIAQLQITIHSKCIYCCKPCLTLHTRGLKLHTVKAHRTCTFANNSRLHTHRLMQMQSCTLNTAKLHKTMHT